MPADSALRRVIYSGRVQGVGFRMTARRIARQYAISGFVRNLRGGTVELVASGAPDEVERYLAAVADAMSGCIARADETAVTGESVGEGFEIRY